jgi:hypothetical protein
VRLNVPSSLFEAWSDHFDAGSVSSPQKSPPENFKMNARWIAFPLLVAGATVLGQACTISTTTPGPGDFICGADSEPCQVDDDCCDFFCNGGLCDANANAACLPDGTDCGADSDCCSDICDDSNSCSSGVVVVADCNDDSDPCASDDDCCSDFCNGGVCDG